MQKKRISKSAKQLLLAVCRWIFIITFTYLLLYPFLYILVNSFKSGSDYYDPTVQWIPKTIVFDNIIAAFQGMKFARSMLNTVLYGLLPGVISFCSCAVFAYGMARFEFRGKKLLSATLFLNLLVPVSALIIPTYIGFQKTDFFGILSLISKIAGRELRPSIVDTPWAFIIPAMLGVGLKCGLFIYIYMQFFKSLPRELEEAAWIDGAGSWRTFLSIIVPSSGSAAVTVLIFSVLWNYSDYYLPQVYLSENYPLSVSLNQFRYSLGSIMEYYSNQADAVEKYVLLSACLLFLIPVIIFFLFVQKKFIAGITTTGLVG